MRILLINADAPYNLAISKLNVYYKLRGDIVDIINLNLSYYKPNTVRYIDGSNYDKIYVSMIFETSRNCIKVLNGSPEYGGIGYDVGSALPPEIDSLEPEPENGVYWNYITRGCIRKCYFCKVWRAEGYIHLNKHPADMNLTNHNEFLDNNIFAYPDHISILEWLQDHKIKYRFNQGLDFRLATDENMELIGNSRYIDTPTFAYDDIGYKSMIESKLPIIRKYIPRKYGTRWYVYINYNDPLENALERIEFLLENQCLPYIMRDRNCYGNDDKSNVLKDLSAYYNQPLFKTKTLAQFVDLHNKDKDRVAKTLSLVEGFKLNF